MYEIEFLQTSLFHIDYAVKWSFIELIPFGELFSLSSYSNSLLFHETRRNQLFPALLGAFGGILGSVFTVLNIRWCRTRKENRLVGGNPIYEVRGIGFMDL